MQQPQITGLSALGDAIDTLRQEARADALRKQAREQQLADVASERQFITGRDEAQRAFAKQQLDTQHTWDVERQNREYQQNLTRELVLTGYLKENETSSPELVAQAIEKARRDGLDLVARNNYLAAINNSPDVTPEEKAIANRTDPRDAAAMQTLQTMYAKAVRGDQTRYGQDVQTRQAVGARMAAIDQQDNQLWARNAELQKIIDQAGEGLTNSERTQIENQLQAKYGTKYLEMRAKGDPILSKERTTAEQLIIIQRQKAAEAATREMRAIAQQINANAMTRAHLDEAVKYHIPVTALGDTTPVATAPVTSGAKPTGRPPSNVDPLDAVLGGGHAAAASAAAPAPDQMPWDPYGVSTPEAPVAAAPAPASTPPPAVTPSEPSWIDSAEGRARANDRVAAVLRRLPSAAYDAMTSENARILAPVLSIPSYLNPGNYKQNNVGTFVYQEPALPWYAQ